MDRDPAALAAVQLEAHRANLSHLEELKASATEEVPVGVRLALEGGIGHAREYVRFWTQVKKAS